MVVWYGESLHPGPASKTILLERASRRERLAAWSLTLLSVLLNGIPTSSIYASASKKNGEVKGISAMHIYPGLQVCSDVRYPNIFESLRVLHRPHGITKFLAATSARSFSSRAADGPAPMAQSTHWICWTLRDTTYHHPSITTNCTPARSLLILVWSLVVHYCAHHSKLNDIDDIWYSHYERSDKPAREEPQKHANLLKCHRQTSLLPESCRAFMPLNNAVFGLVSFLSLRLCRFSGVSIQFWLKGVQDCGILFCINCIL